MPFTPRGSLGGFPAGMPNGPDRRTSQARKAQRTVGNAISSHGIWSQPNRATSRLSGPAENLGAPGPEKRPRKITCTWPIRATLNKPNMPSMEMPGVGFFHGFARGAFLERLAKLQIARGQCPEASARLDRTAAHEDLAV
jgi:hypothetical protein